MQISQYVLLSALAALPLISGGMELFEAGDFEHESYAPLQIKHLVYHGNQRDKAPEGAVASTVQSARFFAGENALLLTADQNGTHELNLINLPVKAGKKYSFRMRYFVEEKAGTFYIGCRLAMPRKDQKPSNSFLKGKTETGQWLTLENSFYPPADTTGMHLTVWIGKGPYKVYIDDLKVTEIDEVKSVDGDSNTGLIMRDDQLTVWKQSNYRRIDVRKVPENLKKTDAVELSCAANEMEPFQLAVFPRKDMKQLSLEISDLSGSSGKIAADRQSYGIVRYASLSNPNNPTLKGEIADPIVAEKTTDAPAGQNTVFFVRLFAPRGTPAGVYSGTLALKSGNSVICRVPLKLKVRNFELPDTPAVRSLFYANPGMTCDGYKDIRGVNAVAEDLSTILKNHRITGSQCILTPVPPYTIAGDELTVTDWSGFDSEVKRMYEQHGVRDFILPVLRVFGFSQGWRSANITIFNEPLFSEKARKLAADFARQIHEHWMKTMPADALYYSYIYDEAPEKVYEELNRFMDYVKSRVPEFRFCMTHEVEPKLRGVDVFIVPFSYAYVKPEMEKGREIWYYNWTQPLDHAGYIRNRLFAWQIYANGGRGGLKWQTTHIANHSNPWKELDKTYRDGEATTIYPAVTPGGNLVPSLRLAQTREAVDDGDYLKLLEKEVEKSFPGKGRSYVCNFIRELLPQLPFAYTNDAELLYRLRNDLGDEIENFNQPPVALVTSVPLNNSVLELPQIRFSVRGPDGAQVLLNGKASGVIAGGVCHIDHTLDKMGGNTIFITVKHNGKSKDYRFVYTLRKDANLKKLAALTLEMRKFHLSTDENRKFLDSIENAAYTGEARARCAELLAEGSRKLMQAKLASITPGKKPVVNALNDQAKLMFRHKLYQRADYYLALAKTFDKYDLSRSSGMKIEPVNLHGNFGFRISNGIIEFILLEMGGRVVSFKVNGVETLDAGHLHQSLPLEVRAGKRFDNLAARDIPFLGGYEDAEVWLLPESAVDWDIAVKEISDKRIALECSMLLRGGKFRISRVMICEAGGNTLDMKYTISNVLPADYKSDDPTHYHFNWRARLLPKIGKSRQGDILDVPSETALPETRFDSNKPVFYEKRSIPLAQNMMRVSDPAEKTALIWKIDPRIKYAYIWFDSRNSGRSKGLYTLEVFRSFFGQTPGAAANEPFYIEPGKSVNFTVSLQGRTL